MPDEAEKAARFVAEQLAASKGQLPLVAALKLTHAHQLGSPIAETGEGKIVGDLIPFSSREIPSL
jgi:hypothetical protein